MLGYSTALQGANTLNTLGQNEFSQNLDAINAQRQAGNDLYGLDQQQYDFNFSQWNEEQNMPYKQAGFMSSIYNALPTDQTRTIYGASPNSATTAVGLTGAALGLARGGLAGGLGGLYMRDR
jgi:hypothetical protein